MGISAALTLQNQTLLLLPERAVFWKQAQMLIVADPHFGKSQVFRDKGIPVPEGTTADDLRRLSLLLKRHDPIRILFLGDLIHGRFENTERFDALIDQWRTQHHQTQIFLVTGNHDRRAGQLLPPFRIDRTDRKLTFGPFAFSHEPNFDTSSYGMAGHVHPAVTVSGKGRQKETLPCFCFGPRGALLPSFGSFTGVQVIRPLSGDDVYLIAGDEVIAMTRARLR